MAGALLVVSSAIMSLGINLFVHYFRNSSKYVDIILKVLFCVGNLNFVKN